MIKKIFFIATVFLMVSCGSSKKVTQEKYTNRKVVDKRTKPIQTNTTQKVVTKPVANNTATTSDPTLADKVIWTAVSYKGTSYRMGGTSKSGMDCSGLVYTSFKTRGVDLPRSSSMMNTKGYNISLKEVKRGDLVFFKTTNKSRSRVNHVGLVTSATNGDIKFIHSTSSRGVIVTSLHEKYWNKAFVEAKRVIE